MANLWRRLLRWWKFKRQGTTVRCYLCDGRGTVRHGTEKDPGPDSVLVESTCSLCGGAKVLDFNKPWGGT